MDKQSLIRECEQLMQLEPHKNVIKLHDFFFSNSKNHLLLVYDFYHDVSICLLLFCIRPSFCRFYFTLQQSESLKSKILNCKKLSEMIGDLDVISINIQIADALAYLHQNDIIHRNMNPS